MKLTFSALGSETEVETEKGKGITALQIKIKQGEKQIIFYLNSSEAKTLAVALQEK